MTEAAPPEATHLVDFFATYPDFDYNPGAPVSSEFRRLVRGWDRESPEYEEAWSGFGQAMGKQFASFYGSDVHDIIAWQSLCIALGVDPLPESIPGCKRIMKTKHVNLVDFIDELYQAHGEDLPKKGREGEWRFGIPPS